MTVYELMVKTNHYLIKSGVFTEAQKQNIVRQLLAAKSSAEQAQRFYASVKFPKNVDGDGRQMYPVFYIPPYNDGKKYQTIIPMSPKTHILSSNAYELEILRLLQLFAPENAEVENMITETLKRLKTTCFAYQNCAVGECFHSALIALRFIASTAPDEKEWINKLITFFNTNIGDKLANKRIHGNVLWYYWLCLSELPIEIAEPEIKRYQEQILRQLNRSYVMNSDNDKINHSVMICAIRNTIARLQEYSYIKSRQPYVSDKDGRLYFDMIRGIENE